MSKLAHKRFFHAIFSLLAFYCCIALVHLLWFGNLGKANLWIPYAIIGAAGAIVAALGWLRLSQYALCGAAAGLFVQYTVQVFVRPATLAPGIWCNAAVSLAALIVGIAAEVVYHRPRR